MTECHPRFRALPSPTYLRPPKRGLRVGGSGFAQAQAMKVRISREYNVFSYLLTLTLTLTLLFSTHKE